MKKIIPIDILSELLSFYKMKEKHFILNKEIEINFLQTKEEKNIILTRLILKELFVFYKSE